MQMILQLIFLLQLCVSTQNKKLNSILSYLVTNDQFKIISNQGLAYTDKECSICLQDLIVQSDFVIQYESKPDINETNPLLLIESTVRKCPKNKKHLFHTSCFEKWLKSSSIMSSKNIPTCPVCRESIENYSEFEIPEYEIANVLLKSLEDIPTEYKIIVINFLSKYLSFKDNIASYILLNDTSKLVQPSILKIEKKTTSLNIEKYNFNSESNMTEAHNSAISIPDGKLNISNQIIHFVRTFQVTENNDFDTMIEFINQITEIKSNPIKLILSEYFQDIPEEYRIKAITHSFKITNLPKEEIIKELLFSNFAEIFLKHHLHLLFYLKDLIEIEDISKTMLKNQIKIEEIKDENSRILASLMLFVLSKTDSNIPQFIMDNIKSKDYEKKIMEIISVCTKMPIEGVEIRTWLFVSILKGMFIYNKLPIKYSLFINILDFYYDNSNEYFNSSCFNTLCSVCNIISDITSEDVVEFYNHFSDRFNVNSQLYENYRAIFPILLSKLDFIDKRMAIEQLYTSIEEVKKILKLYQVGINLLPNNRFYIDNKMNLLALIIEVPLEMQRQIIDTGYFKNTIYKLSSSYNSFSEFIYILKSFSCDRYIIEVCLNNISRSSLAQRFSDLKDEQLIDLGNILIENNLIEHMNSFIIKILGNPEKEAIFWNFISNLLKAIEYKRVVLKNAIQSLQLKYLFELYNQKYAFKLIKEVAGISETDLQEIWVDKVMRGLVLKNNECLASCVRKLKKHFIKEGIDGFISYFIDKMNMMNYNESIEIFIDKVFELLKENNKQIVGDDYYLEDLINNITYFGNISLVIKCIENACVLNSNYLIKKACVELNNKLVKYEFNDEHKNAIRNILLKYGKHDLIEYIDNSDNDNLFSILR